MRKPPTGEPCAGEPPTRFGGRGGPSGPSLPLSELECAKKPARLPVVFTREEARAVLARLDGIGWVMASLLYGSGLRLMECTRARQGRGLRPPPAHRAGREGRQRHAPGADRRALEDASGQGRRAAPRRTSRRGSGSCTCPLVTFHAGQSVIEERV